MNGIRAIRAQLGMTQQAFAEGIDMTQANVSLYESRGQTVPPSVARRVIDLACAHGFTCSMDDVYAAEPKLKRARPSRQARTTPKTQAA